MKVDKTTSLYYPKPLVWLRFSLIGDIIGGLFFGTSLAIGEWGYLKESVSILNTIKDILISGIIGFFVGFCL